MIDIYRYLDLLLLDKSQLLTKLLTSAAHVAGHDSNPSCATSILNRKVSAATPPHPPFELLSELSLCKQ